MRFKGRKWASPFFIISLAFAGIFGASAAVINKQVEETPVAEKADAATSDYAGKVYVEIDSSVWGDMSYAKVVFAHVWKSTNTSVAEDIDMWHYEHNNITESRKFHALVDSKYDRVKFGISNTAGQHYWTAGSADLTMPGANSAARWYTWKTSGAGWSNATVSRIYGVDNGTVTCNLSGDYVGIDANYTEHEYIRRGFTVTVGNIPSNKEVTLGQYSDSNCTTKINEFELSGNTYTASSWTMNGSMWFKPILHDKMKVVFNGGSKTTYLSCDHLLNESKNYTATSVSMTADHSIAISIGNTTISPTYSYGSNIYTSGSTKYVKESNTGDITISYNGSSYSAIFGALGTKSWGYYVLNFTTGDLYGTSDKGSGNYGTAVTYLNDSEVIRFMYSTGSNNSYYSIKEVNSYSTAGVYSLSGGDVTIIGSDYYYLEIQPTDSGKDKLYIESYGVTITYNLNGHGNSFTDRVERNQTFSKPSDPSSTGYTFAGWYKEAGCTNAWNFASDTTSTNKTLYAKWTKNTNSISYALNGGTHGTNHPTSSSYDTVFYVSAPTKTGYTFTGWTVTSGLNSSTAKWGTTDAPATQIASSSTLCVNGASGNVYFKNINAAGTAVQFTANWTPNTDTPYTVNHYQQNLDGSYPSTPTDTDNLTGTTGEEVTPDVNTYTGFTGPSAETVTIAADGSTVVNYQYTRNGYLLQLHMYTGVGTIYYKFEGAAEYSSTTRDTNVWPLYGQTVYLYATARGGYKMDNDYTEDDPLVIVMDENGYNWTPTATSGESAAITFATNFNTRIGGICVYAGGTNFNTLKTEWNGTQQAAYNNLEDYQKYWLDKDHASSDDNVQDMFAMYDYIAHKYGTGSGDDKLHDFLNRNNSAQAAAINNFSPFDYFTNDENDLSTLIIVIASSISLLSITALSVLMVKKRKHKGY